MEAVKSFNSELSSLYEVKPPISKAKMTALTRGAIKAIKFYKHVVQSVEKFILKCKPEYKVPGLYVIDSIVRQSRHQFGPEKDVFAPRFAKSLQQTFVNLFKCPPEDKSKIIRVLNLWQKNQVFPAEVIQPLFDFADPNNPIHQQIQQQSTPVQQTNGTAASAQQQVVKGSPALQRTPTKANQSTASEAPTPNLSLTEPVLQQLQQLQRLLTKGTDTARPEQVHFDKKLLDFDYDDDEEEVNPSPRPPPQPSATDSVASLLTNPEVLRQLQTLQNTLAGAVHAPSQQDADAEKLKKLQEMKMQEDEFDKHLAQTVPNLPFASECEFKPSQTSTMIGGLHFIPPPVDGSQMSQNYMPQLDNAGYGGNQNSSGNDVEVITLDQDDSHSPSGDRYKRKRSRSRSRDKGRDRRRRSRSRSRSRRYRSRSKDRKEKDKKDKEKETERDKERKKRGLPIIKKDNLTVCSTTLWVGHLSKLVHQDDLSNTFGEFGEIVSIDLISPRGCAFIVMHRRQDAARCLTKLKNYNLHGKAITLAWAPGKGVKGKELKDYWEGDLGVSYIPWSKLKEDMDLEALEDGGTIDEDTMPSWMREKMEEMNKKKVVNTSEKPPFLMGVGEVPNQSTIDTSQPPPLPPSNLLQPPILPMVNPFQLNNRFLSMIPNMSSLPNMSNMPNLPIGVPPPNMPPSMMPNLGLGLGSPFQGPPGFMPSLPPPQETKPAPPPTTDSKLRNLSESLMNLAGQPLTMPPHPPMSQLSMTQPPMTQPPMTQPPPPIHTQSTDDNMDVEMEDAEHGNNKPNIPLSEQLQASMNVGFNRDNRRDEGRFSPGRRDSRDNRDNRRDDRSSDRSRRRSKSRDRDQNRPPKEHFSPRPPKEPFSPRDRDRIDRGGGRINSRDRDRRDRDRDGRENRDRDFGRGRDRDSRDRRAGDRERGNRWGPPDRRDERRDGPYDRRGGPPDRRDGPPNRRDGPPDRRDGPPDRRDGLQSRRDGMQDRRDSSDSRDRNDREKTLNERLKEMAGMKFDEPDDRSSKDRRPSGDGTRDDAQSQSEEFQTRTGESSKVVIEESRGDASQANRRRDDDDDPDFRSPQIKEFRNASPPELRTPPGQEERPDFSLPPPPIGEIQSDYRTSPRVEPPTEKQIQENFATSMEGSFGPDGASSFGPNDSEGPGQFGPPGAPGIFGSDNTNSFGPDGPGPFGPDGPGSFGPDGPGLFGPDGPGPFGPDGPDSYGPNSRGPFGSGRFSPDGPGRFGPDGPPYMEQGPPFGDDGYGPPPDMMDGPPGFGGPGFGPDFGPPGFNGPPDRFMRGGRRGRQRGGRRGGRDGPPDFFPPRDDFGPPMIDEFGPRMRGDDFGPPMRDDDFGPPMRDDFGPPMRDDFGPPMRDDFGPPMRDDDFGPPFGPRGRGRRGRGFFGPRGRGGEHGAPPFRDGPPGGFAPDFNGPPDFFRGGPRGGPRFSEPFPRGRGGRFRGGRGRPGPDFFDGPSGDFFGPPGGPPFEGGPPFDGPFEGGPPPDFDAGPFEGGAPPFESRRGRGRKNRSSRWASNDGGDAPEHIEGPPGDEFINQEASVIGGGEGGGTPLRDEINDSGPPLEDFAGPQDFPEESHPQQEQDAQDGGNDVAEQGDEAPPAE